MECVDYISEIERKAASHGVKLHAMYMRAGFYPHNVWRWKTGRSSPTLRKWREFQAAMTEVFAQLDAKRLADAERAA